jgi:hypothetical protein
MLLTEFFWISLSVHFLSFVSLVFSGSAFFVYLFSSIHVINSHLTILFFPFADAQSSEVRTLCAEGYAKLLLAGRVVSPSLLSRLLLLWYNPLTEDDTRLRHLHWNFPARLCVCFQVKKKFFFTNDSVF